MIRKAEERDASRLAEILIFAKRTAYRSIFQNDFVSFNQMQVLDLALSYRDEPDNLKDVYVYDDGIVKAMMSWERFPEKEAAWWELKQFYVDPFFWHQKIGRRMIEEFFRHAKENGKDRVFLWVLEKNRRARVFYEKSGFYATESMEKEPGTTEWLMRYERIL